MRPQPQSSRLPLSVCAVFEPSRLGARCLSDAYAYVAPILPPPTQQTGLPADLSTETPQAQDREVHP